MQKSTSVSPGTSLLSWDSESNASPAASPLKATVLVVEDELLVRTAVAEFLRDCSFRVIEAGMAIDAMAILEAGESIDVVFSDIRMPGEMDGFQLAAWIHKRFPTVDVILTSGYSDVRNLPDFLKYGTHIAKPYSYDALLVCIEALMAKRLSRGA